MEQLVSVKYDDFTFIFNLTRRLDRFDVHDRKHNLSRNLHSWILLLIPRPAHGHDDYDDDYDDDDDGDDDGDDDDDDDDDDAAADDDDDDDGDDDGGDADDEDADDDDDDGHLMAS